MTNFEAKITDLCHWCLPVLLPPYSLLFQSLSCVDFRRTFDSRGDSKLLTFWQADSWIISHSQQKRDTCRLYRAQLLGNRERGTLIYIVNGVPPDYTLQKRSHYLFFYHFPNRIWPMNRSGTRWSSVDSPSSIYQKSKTAKTQEHPTRPSIVRSPAPVKSRQSVYLYSRLLQNCNAFILWFAETLRVQGEGAIEGRAEHPTGFYGFPCSRANNFRTTYFYYQEIGE